MGTNESNPEPVKVPKRVWRLHAAEFKARAIALARQSHAWNAGIALANGIKPNMLRNWVRKASAANADLTSRRDDGKSTHLSFLHLPVRANNPLPSPASLAKKLAP